MLALSKDLEVGLVNGDDHDIRVMCLDRKIEYENLLARDHIVDGEDLDVRNGLRGCEHEADGTSNDQQKHHGQDQTSRETVQV